MPGRPLAAPHSCRCTTLPPCLPMPRRRFVEFLQATILEWPAPEGAYVLSEQQVCDGGRPGGLLLPWLPPLLAACAALPPTSLLPSRL